MQRNIFFNLITLLFLFGVFLIPTKASELYPDGSLVKGRGEAKIYQVFKDQRYWIRNPEIFKSYNFSWEDIKEVDVNELTTYKTVELITFTGDPSKIYYIQGAEKRWITSPAAFNANGFNWGIIKSLNWTDFNSYSVGGNITGRISGETVVIDLQAVGDPNIPKGVDFNTLWNTWKTIEDKFIDSTELEYEKLVQGAADGLVRALQDPYSAFVKPEESQKFSEDIVGSFGGIGAELGYKDGIVVVAPLKGNPAEKAGLRAGDRIIRIDGESTADMTLEGAVIKIRGEVGVDVTLLIDREGFAAPRPFTIKRAVITIPSVDWSKKTNDIAYIKIYNFFGSTENDFRTAVEEAIQDGMKKLILDLRDNPGGLLQSSINIAAEFIPDGDLIVVQDFGSQKGKREIRSIPGGLLEQIPTVVLINEGSASASEIVAGALKDSRNITLIGEKTFGKGTVQEVLRISGGATLKITVARWLRPSGKVIEEAGIEPDIKVELTELDRSSGIDPQLDKAIEVVRALPL